MSGTIWLSGDDIWSSRTVQFRWMLKHASERLEQDPEIVRALEVASAVQGLNIPSVDERLRGPILKTLLEVSDEMASGDLAPFPGRTDMDAVYVRKARELAEMIRRALGGTEARERDEA